MNYIYILARTDPSFSIDDSPLGVQAFCNGITAQADAELRATAKTLPTHASVVNASDGYKPSAMLFVDEEWVANRSAREGNLGKLLWRPVVRFCSTHYQYVQDARGVRIVQVGIGADDKTDGLHFGAPPAATAAAQEARAVRPRALAR